MMNVYIGWDPNETQSYDLASYSLYKRAGKSDKVFVRSLIRNKLRADGVFWRPAGVDESSEFTITRFLVPYLMVYDGWALYVDCDVLFLSDVAELFALADERYAVMCVQHEYKPDGSFKKTGQKQQPYPRKNWSSVVLWNCSHPANERLNLSTVNGQTPAYLHRFHWLKDEEIGRLPPEWNVLVGWDRCSEPKLLHFTEGAPNISDYRFCEYSDTWKRELMGMYAEDISSERGE